MKKSEWKGVIKYMLLILAISSFFTANIQYGTAVTPNRFHCGYRYSSVPPGGVKADIYTISIGTILRTTTFQWVSIVLSYSPSYWLQVGYKKWWNWIWIWPFPVTDFYFERVDSQVTEHSWFWWNRPVAGVTYTYSIRYNYGNMWVWHIKQGSTVIHTALAYPNPYSPIDFQAMSETTTTRNVITGTHFTQLSKASGGSSWVYWDDHYPSTYYPPYVLQDMGHYEFKASGGTG